MEVFMSKPVEMIAGQRFGYLTYIKDTRMIKRARYALFQCDCGNTVETNIHRPRTGVTKSCGCLKIKTIKLWATKHGATCGRKPQPEYKSWLSMKERCCKPQNKSYKNYGGRGITICESWLHSFETFFADMGNRPSRRHSIERIDVNGNYEPSNCKWATPKEQARNTRTARFVTINGISKQICEWADESGIRRETIWRRLNDGWDALRAVFEPVRKMNAEPPPPKLF
jgi:hypothetical protein